MLLFDHSEEGIFTLFSYNSDSFLTLTLYTHAQKTHYKNQRLDHNGKTKHFFSQLKITLVMF